MEYAKRLKAKAGLVLVKNEYHAEDLSFVFKYNRWLLYITASWPFTSQDRALYRIGNQLLSFVQTLLFLCVIVPFILETCLVEKNAVQKVKNIAFINLMTGYTVKYYVTKFHNRTVRSLIDQMDSDWENIFAGSRGIMLNYAKISRFCLMTCAGFLLMAWLSWQYVAIFKESEKLGNLTIHHLPYPSYFVIFEARIAPYFYYVQTIQFVTLFILITVICNTCTSVTFALHACSQYSILVTVVKNIGNDTKTLSENTDVTLISVVKKHYELIRFSTNVETAFSWTFFIEWFNCILGVCSANYYYVVEKEGFNGFFKNFTLLASLSCIFLLVCYIGEELTFQCISLGEAAYMSSWYNLPKKQVYELIMLNNTYKFPKRLTAGKIIVLSMETFSDVMKKAMAIFSLLKKMM